MALPNQGAPGFTFAGFLILAALGSFLWTSHDPKSNRPSSNNDIDPVKLEEGDIPARLWQDPYRALDKFLKKDKNNRLKVQNLSYKNNSLHKRIIQHSNRTGLTIIGVMVDTDPYAESEERRRQRRYAIVSALSEMGYVPDEEKLVHAIRLNYFDQNKIPGLTNQKQQASVIVNKYITNELKENPGIVGKYLIKEEKKNVEIVDKTITDPDKVIFPYEWYAHNSDAENYPCVLVVWLDEAKFSNKPLTGFAKFAKNLDIDGANLGNITLKILGPASSTTLKKMYEEFPGGISNFCNTKDSMDLIPIKDLGLAGFHVLSPVATVANEYLTLPDEKEVSDEVDRRLKHESNTGMTDRISFLRTIRTDKVLAGELVNELNKRKIIKEPKATLTKEEHLKNGSVVLISEWDTVFGRSLPLSFKEKFCENRKKCNRVIEYNYFRGVDGIAPGTTDLGRVTLGEDNRKSKESVTDKSATKVRRPVGTGQYDYFQRLSDEIVRLNKYRYKNYGKGVVAIGILGSDVYDKLMILKILRSKFPSAIFFTTDLDAQLLHPSDFKWTRNIIVASSFGLRLNDQLQLKTAPFRNNYQTSLFFSTLLSVEYNRSGSIKDLSNFTQDNINNLIVPTVAEIGRYGVVVLNKTDLQAADTIKFKDTEKSVQVVNVDEYYENGPNQALLMFFIILVIIFAWIHLNHKGLVATVWLLAGLAVFSLLTYGAFINGNGEPFSFSNGTSVWPSFYIRVLVVLLAVFFVKHSMNSLNENRDELTQKYLGDYEKIDIDTLTNTDVDDNGIMHKIHALVFHNALVKKIVAFRNKIENRLRKRFIEKETFFNRKIVTEILKHVIWFRYIFASILFLLLAFVVMKLGRQESTVSNVSPLVISGLIALLVWFSTIYLLFKVHSINTWRRALASGDNSASLVKIWDVYHQHGEFFHRFIRSLSLVLIYFVFAASLFLLLGSSPPPSRGDIPGLFPITLLSVIGMLFLIFFVVDATRLCTAWITALIDNETKWNTCKLSNTDDAQDLGSDVTVLWLKMNMIAERTRVVGELIYYPFIVILLMLLSRVSYFDHWGFPQALAIIVAINIVIATSNGFRLRNVAEHARSKILDQLNNCYIHVQGKQQASDYPPPQQIKTMIDNIKEIREGAYKPLLEQPVVRAFILALGGIGFTISQYSSALN